MLIGGLSTILLMSGLGAYNVGPVPVQWIGEFLAILIAGLLLISGGIRINGDILRLLFLVGWSVALTVALYTLSTVTPPMPPYATTAYPVFIGLRILGLLSFVAQVIIVQEALRTTSGRRVMTLTVVVGSVIAIMAIYIYIAQVYGLPELPRTRAGTSGAEQATHFQYAFHRAMGTFREPSHLAEWLVVPLFLSLALAKNVISIHPILIGSALLLTGSLTGIMAAVIGLVAGMVLLQPFSRARLVQGARIMAAAAVGWLVFSALVSSNTATSADVLTVIWQRLEPILTDGMGESNRSYIYDYIAQAEFPLLGRGLGNANLDLSAFRATGAVSSFLSIYFNFAYSTGLVGVGLLMIMFATPLKRVVVHRLVKGGVSHQDVYLIGAYIGWLVIFAVHAEAFTAMFAIIFGILTFRQHTGPTGVNQRA